MSESSYYFIPMFIVTHRHKLIIPSMIATGLLAFAIVYADVQYANPKVPYGQLSIEYAATYNNAHYMIDDMTAFERKWARNSVIFDYVFLILYSLTLALLSLIRGNADGTSALIACAVVFGGLFDAIEDTGLLIMLDETQDFHPYLPPFVTLMATIKFTLLAIGAVYILFPFKLSAQIKQD